MNNNIELNADLEPKTPPIVRRELKCPDAPRKQRATTTTPPTRTIRMAAMPVEEQLPAPLHTITLPAPIPKKWRSIQQVCPWCKKHIFSMEDISVYDGDNPEYAEWLAHDSCNRKPSFGPE
jgi:hypothetical protein